MSTLHRRQTNSRIHWLLRNLLEEVLEKVWKIFAWLRRRDVRCAKKRQPQPCRSADAESDVADGFGAEALFQSPQNVDLGNLLEIVVQSGLENADV